MKTLTLTIGNWFVKIDAALTNEFKISAKSRGATIAICRLDGSCLTVRLTSVGALCTV
jgi:hypothetical protein